MAKGTSKGKAKARRERNRQRVEIDRRSRHLPAGVPNDALFCNVTEITNKFIRQGCNLTVNPLMRFSYLACGVLLGVFGVTCRIFFDISTLVLVLILVLGFSLVWQSMHLGMEPARRMMRQFSEAGDKTRRHVYFATQDDLGVVLFDGTVRRFGWEMIDEFSGTKTTFALLLKGATIVFIMDASGFVRGSAEDFVKFAFEKIDPTPKGWLYTTSERMFRALDNWSVIKAQSRAAEAARKAERKARRRARRKDVVKP